MNKKICLIGSSGKWGARILNTPGIDVWAHFDIAEGGEDEFWKRLAEAGRNEVVVVLAVPPGAREALFKRLQQFDCVAEILCEKPLPNESQLPAGKVVKVVDHYLYKKNASRSVDYFRENRSRIGGIKLRLLESAIESRGWMLDRRAYGGVTYDLAHHLIALVGRMFGFQSLVSVDLFKVRVRETFSEAIDSSDRLSSFSFRVNGVLIEIEVGKECEENRKDIQFFDLSEKPKPLKRGFFDFSEAVDYRKILSDIGGESSELLSLEESSVIGGLIERVVNRCDRAEYIENLRTHKSDALGLIQDLTESFKHRHQFYWASYYRLLIYHLALIAMPAVTYFYASGIASLAEANWLPRVFFLFSLVIFGGTFYFLKETEKYLSAEDHRLKLVIERSRELYFSVYGINLYPESGQYEALEEVLDGSVNRAGIGGDYMFTLFRVVCIFAASLSSVVLFIVAFWNSLISPVFQFLVAFWGSLA